MSAAVRGRALVPIASSSRSISTSSPRFAGGKGPAKKSPFSFTGSHSPYSSNAPLSSTKDRIGQEVHEGLHPKR